MKQSTRHTQALRRRHPLQALHGANCTWNWSRQLVVAQQEEPARSSTIQNTHMIEVTRTMHMRLKTAAFFRQRTRGQSGCQWLMGCPQSAGCHSHPRSCVVHITQHDRSTQYYVAIECAHGRDSPVVTYFKLTRSPMVLGMNPDRWFSKSASSLRTKANKGRQSDDYTRKHAFRRWAWAS